MYINYPELIAESELELQLLERKYRDKWGKPRIQMLRLLKSGRARSLRECGPLLGYSVRQVHRWWQQYRMEGVAGLVSETNRAGRQSQLTDAAAEAVRLEIEAGRVCSLEQARRYLSERWAIHYDSLNGVSWMLRRQGIDIRERRRAFLAAAK
jgi:transposase